MEATAISCPNLRSTSLVSGLWENSYMNPIKSVDAAESILSLFRDDAKRIAVLGQFGRGRVVAPLIAVSEGAAVTSDRIQRHKAIIGVFVGDQSIQFFDGVEVAYEFKWQDVKDILWRDIKFEEPVFQKWMLWEVHGLEASGKEIHLCFASHALALFGEPSVADVFYKSIQPTENELGFSDIRKFKQATDLEYLIQFISDISLRDLP